MNQSQRKEKFNEAFSRVIKNSLIVLDRHNDSATIASVAESKRSWPTHDPKPEHCTGHGHIQCMRDGEHSWFNHSQDSFHASNTNNLPEGFIEP